MPLPFPITVRLTNVSPNDTVELRLINILDSFSSTIGAEDGTDLLISISESQDLVLQPFPDLAGEFNISVQVTITNNGGNEVSSAVTVPVEITAVADEPVVSMEETCFDIKDQMNSIFTIVINVTSQDVDLSEEVSVNVSGGFTFCHFHHIRNIQRELLHKELHLNLKLTSKGLSHDGLTLTSA